MHANAETRDGGQKGQTIDVPSEGAGRAGTLPEALGGQLQSGLALLALWFPWLFSSRWPVIVLVCVALGGVSLLRATVRPDLRPARLLRIARGEIWLGCGLCLVYLLGAAEPVAYCSAVLVVALADPAAALVGRRYGRAQRMLSGARKSAAGALAFFVTALVVVAAGLVAGAGLPLGAALGAAALVATLTTAVEAALGDGLDNLFVPLTALAALESTVF